MPVSFRIVCCVANQMHLDADQIWLDTNQCTLMQYNCGSSAFKGKSNGFSEFWDIMRVLMLFQSFLDRFNACCKEVNLYSAI